MNVSLVKSEMWAECRQLGTVSGDGMGADPMTAGTVDLRNRAASMGADFVRFSNATPNGPAAVKISGMAYRCPRNTPSPDALTAIAPSPPTAFASK